MKGFLNTSPFRARSTGTLLTFSPFQVCFQLLQDGALKMMHAYTIIWRFPGSMLCTGGQNLFLSISKPYIISALIKISWLKVFYHVCYEKSNWSTADLSLKRIRFLLLFPDGLCLSCPVVVSFTMKHFFTCEMWFSNETNACHWDLQFSRRPVLIFQKSSALPHHFVFIACLPVRICYVVVGTILSECSFRRSLPQMIGVRIEMKRSSTPNTRFFNSGIGA